MSDITRRAYLKSGAAGILGAFAGCTTDPYGDTTPPTATETPRDTTTETPQQTSTPDGSASSDVGFDGDQYRLPSYDDWVSIGGVEVRGGGVPFYDIIGNGEPTYAEPGREVTLAGETYTAGELYNEIASRIKGEDDFVAAYPGGEIRVCPEGSVVEIPPHDIAEADYNPDVNPSSGIGTRLVGQIAGEDSFVLTEVGNIPKLVDTFKSTYYFDYNDDGAQSKMVLHDSTVDGEFDFDRRLRIEGETVCRVPVDDY